MGKMNVGPNTGGGPVDGTSYSSSSSSYAYPSYSTDKRPYIFSGVQRAVTSLQQYALEGPETPSCCDYVTRPCAYLGSHLVNVVSIFTNVISLIISIAAVIFNCCFNFLGTEQTPVKDSCYQLGLSLLRLPLLREMLLCGGCMATSTDED